MKKNNIMRLACVVLVLTLLSTCVISGTFAKYVTSGNAGDSAQVAKWGIQIAVEGSDLFVKDYDVANENNAATVAANGNYDVVAPGTANAEGVTFSITGQPEVDFNLAFALTGNGTDNAIVDVVVPAGEYLDWTTANDDDDTFELEADYYPVIYTLKNSEDETLATGNLAAIETFLEGTDATKKVEANTNVTTVLGGNGTYTLTWAWAFSQNDKADTLLGNVIAGIDKETYTEDISTAINFDLAISATQVD